MNWEYTFKEITVMLLLLPIMAMVLVALLNIDALNNMILKAEGTSKLDSIVSNKEAWLAGFKVFYTLLAFSVLTIVFLFTYNSITQNLSDNPGEGITNFFRRVFLFIIIIVGITILRRTVKYVVKK